MNYRILLSYLLNLFFGLLYPTAKSFEAVETGHDDAQWLMYWIIYTFLLIAETLLWPVLKWIPLYGEAKAVLLAWLVLPHFKGATWVYEAVVGPTLTKLQAEIHKVPAIERLLNNEDTHNAGQVTTPEEDVNMMEDRKTKVTLAVQEVRDSLVGELDRIKSLPDLKGKARALRSFDKDLAKITKVAESQGTGSLLKPHIG